MPTTYKVLGQLSSTTSAVSLYTCPSATQTIVSSIVISNREAAENTFRIILRPNNETLADKHYLAYDTPITANNVIALTLGITMDASDQLYVLGSDTNLTFQAFGSEIS
jgi:UDP-glucose 4-epimerase